MTWVTMLRAAELPRLGLSRFAFYQPGDALGRG